uniref:Uncharacterized protein n=1 Tax=Schistosoma japonicum TaxID=6182 RepID=C1LH00_SCHJA|nr:hypothetical protein [Schistosoma japonicum]
MSSSSSSSSSLLYINVLLLVLIHSSIQQGILNDAISNATRRLLEAQDLKNRYLSSIVNTRNSINQKRDNLIDKQPSVKEELEKYEDCQIEVHHKELVNRLLTNLNKFQEELRRNYPKHSEKIIKELNEDIVKMKEYRDTLMDEEENKMCEKPENIDSNDLAKLSELLLKYFEDDYYIALYTLKEEYLSELIKILKNAA